MTEGGTPIPHDEHATSLDLVSTLTETATLVAQLRDPDISLPRAVATYLLYKRKRLSPDSQRGYASVLEMLTKTHTKAKLSDLEPPDGGLILEEFLAVHWGDSAPRTYNKSQSILSDFTKWHVARGTLSRDPMGTVDRAKTRPVHRRAFTNSEVIQILAANTAPRDQIALRLLLFFGLRKGALRGIRLEHFNSERRELTIWTKGGKIQTLQIVDEDVWRLLDGLREPGHHYLLPKRNTRRRTPPTRPALQDLAVGLADARAALTAASVDQHCAVELAELLDTLDLADTRYAIAVDAASTQASVDLTSPIGQHGAHLWWYRSLNRAGVVAKGVTAGRRMHLARHTAIQRVLNVTGNLKAAQALAGHANISTTGDTYTDWSPQQEAETMRTVLA